MKALILCAGRGTRLYPLTYTTPKALMPIANRPVLDYLLHELHDAGIREVGIVVDHVASPVVAFASSMPASDLRVSFLVQSHPRGLAHAVACGREFTGDEPFLVCLGDCFAPGAIAELVAAHAHAAAAATLGLREVGCPERFGIAQLSGARIRRVWEKPATPVGNLAIIGLYAFGPGIYDAIGEVAVSWRNEYELTDAVQTLIDQRQPVAGVMISHHWQDIGRPGDVLAANAHQLRSLAPCIEGALRDCQVHGPVAVGRGSEVHASVLEGPVVIGQDCRISDCFITASTCIGDGGVLRGAEVSGSVLMTACAVDGLRALHASVVGNGSRLTMGQHASTRLQLVVGDRCSVTIGEVESESSQAPDTL